MNRAAWFNACRTNRNRAESRNWGSGLWVRVFASHKAPAWSPTQARHHPRDWTKRQNYPLSPREFFSLYTCVLFSSWSSYGKRGNLFHRVWTAQLPECCCSGERQGLWGGRVYGTGGSGSDRLRTHLCERPWSPQQRKGEIVGSLLQGRYLLDFNAPWE